MLSPKASSALTDVRHQLDYWWENLNSEERTYIIDNRNAELAPKYRHVIFKASRDPVSGGENAYLVVLVSDVQTGGQFRLPAMIRAYVEMASR